MQIDASLIHRYIIINSGLLTKQNKAVVGSFLVPKLWTFSDECIHLCSLLQTGVRWFISVHRADDLLW